MTATLTRPTPSSTTGQSRTTTTTTTTANRANRANRASHTPLPGISSQPSRTSSRRSRLLATSAPFVRASTSQPHPSPSSSSVLSGSGKPLTLAGLREELTRLFTVLVDLPPTASANTRNTYEMCKVLLELCTVCWP